MEKDQSIWRTELEGILAAEVDGFRLVVQAPSEDGGQVRFMVLRKEAENSQHDVVGSGTEQSVRDAMRAARKIAERLLSRPIGRNM